MCVGVCVCVCVCVRERQATRRKQNWEGVTFKSNVGHEIWEIREETNE
jgi:hypothetical protein